MEQNWRESMVRILSKLSSDGIWNVSVNPVDKAVDCECCVRLDARSCYVVDWI